MKNIRSEKGITLVALIITIIVLLILAIVAISAVSGDGILEHAKEATRQTSLAQAEEQAQIYLDEWKIQSKIPGEDKPTFEEFMQEKLPGENAVINNEDGTYTLSINGQTVLATENGVISQLATSATGGVGEITWTYTDEDSSGNISVGDIVTASNNEAFYVIGFIADNTIVKLLAQYYLKEEDGANWIQSEWVNDPCNPLECDFSSTNYWSSEESYPVDLNDTEKYPIPEGVTSIITIAREYGEKTLGIETGRLMTLEEVEELGVDSLENSVTCYPEFMAGAFWLSSARNEYMVACCYGGHLDSACYNEFSEGGAAPLIRPVIEILTADISLTQ